MKAVSCRLLRVMSLVSGAMAVACLSLAVATDFWLLASERQREGSGDTITCRVACRAGLLRTRCSVGQEPNITEGWNCDGRG